MIFHICFCGGCMLLFPFVFVVRAKKVGILHDNSDYPLFKAFGDPNLQTTFTFDHLPL